jgi:hypothetical protein
MLRAMNFRYRKIFVLALCLAAPLVGRAGSWFQEARDIRKQADASAPRSQKFEILPIFNFTPELVSAGAFFQDKGQRVIVRDVKIHLSAPMKRAKGEIVREERERTQHYTGEPTWSGWWREPWKAGYFDYTVTATYKGNVYETSFRISPEGAKVMKGNHAK